MKSVDLAIGIDEASTALEQFSAKAQRQREVLAFLLERSEFLPLSLKEVMTSLSVSAATVKALEDKGYVLLEDVEVFRDPYRGRHFKPTEPLPLTAEQQSVYERIIRQLDTREQELICCMESQGAVRRKSIYRRFSVVLSRIVRPLYWYLKYR